MSLSATNLKKELVAYAGSLGFEGVAVSPATSLLKEEVYLKRWIEEGRAGEMDYMARAPDRAFGGSPVGHSLGYALFD